jgi:hypothetical protein
MKKLVVLSALLGLLALPMFASDFTFGGDATFGFITDFSGDATGYDEKADLTFDVKAKIDDFNALKFSFNGLETSAVGLDAALVTTDLGKWLDLPVGLTVKWGYDDPDWNAFADVTAYGNTGYYDMSPDQYWGMTFLLSYKMLEFELALNPGAKNVVAESVGYLLAGLAVKEPIKGLNAEVYYFQDKSAIDEFGEAKIAFDAAYAAEFGGFGLTAAPTFVYDLGDAADDILTSYDDTEGHFWWSFGVDATYDMFTVDVGVSGETDAALKWLDFSVMADVIEKLQVYAGVELELVEGGDMFQGLDIGVNANIGAVDCKLGYVVTDGFGEGEIGGWFNDTWVDGGLYLLFDVNY